MGDRMSLPTPLVHMSIIHTGMAIGTDMKLRSSYERRAIPRPCLLAIVLRIDLRTMSALVAPRLKGNCDTSRTEGESLVCAFW